MLGLRGRSQGSSPFLANTYIALDRDRSWTPRDDSRRIGGMELIRRTLLWASTNAWISSRLPRRKFVRRAVRKFVPGEGLEDAVLESERLQEQGTPTIITMLGENVETQEGTRKVVDEYRRAMDLARERTLDIEISIKPTHLGLDMDFTLTFENVSTLATHAAGYGTLWIDMESSAYTDSTLELFRALRAEHVNVGICLQACLRRTPDDLESLLLLGPRIRLVKGAYAEPVDVAFPRKDDVDANYLSLAQTLIGHVGGGQDGFLALGTHDPAMIDPLANQARDAGLGPEQFEVEMLYGISRREQKRLVKRGVPLRVLISYGTAWFPWYMRRLAERPANIWFVVRSMVR